MAAEKQNDSLPIIAILGGTGKEGPALALRWASAGYPILIGSRQGQKARATAAELKARLEGASIQGMENALAARQADICVLTVVQSAHAEILAALEDDLQGKILVDTTARVDFRDPHPPESPAAASLAQRQLGPGVKVAAAFQNVPSSALKQNLGGKIDVDILVCADDPQVADTVIQLSKGAGMSAYYAGRLENAVVVEGLTAILISLNKHYGGHASIRVTGIETGKSEGG